MYPSVALDELAYCYDGGVDASSVATGKGSLMFLSRSSYLEKLLLLGRIERETRKL